MSSYIPSSPSTLIFVTSIWVLIFLANPYPVVAESSKQTVPPVFQPDETQHGFSEFESMPEIPSPTPNQASPQGSKQLLVPPNDPNKPPEGLFYQLDFAKDFEEEEGIRRGHFVAPIDPSEVFSPDRLPVFLVFRVHQHYGLYQVFGRLYPENVNGFDPSTLIDEDAMHLATEDDSGYLQFDPPGDSWPVGSYRVEIFVGFEATKFNLMGTMRFSVAARSTTP